VPHVWALEKRGGASPGCRGCETSYPRGGGGREPTWPQRGLAQREYDPGGKKKRGNLRLSFKKKKRRQRLLEIGRRLKQGGWVSYRPLIIRGKGNKRIRQKARIWAPNGGRRDLSFSRTKERGRGYIKGVNAGEGAESRLKEGGGMVGTNQTM